MKILIAFVLFSGLAQAAETIKSKTQPVNPAVVKKTQARPTAAAAKVLPKKEEDCDEKAKKPVEIKETTISLGGNTGCSLDEATP